MRRFQKVGNSEGIDTIRRLMARRATLRKEGVVSACPRHAWPELWDTEAAGEARCLLLGRVAAGQRGGGSLGLTAFGWHDSSCLLVV